MRRSPVLRGMAVLAGLILVGACSSSSKSSVSTGGTGSGGSTTTAASAGPITVQLTHMPKGTVTLTWDSSSKIITAAVDMTGFTPGMAHAMHIHTGSCLNQHNPPVIPFPDIQADATGAIKASVMSNPVAAGIPNSAYLNIHLAPGAQLGSPGDVNFTPIACADIPTGTAAAGPVALSMKSLPQAGQSPQGMATLTYDATAQSLKVEIKITGLVPNSTHAAHIHTGTCEDQGAVIHGLNDLTADASGSVDDTTTVNAVTSPPPGSGWYVNVHFTGSSGILSGGKPTIQFQPILCGNVGM